MSLLKRNKNEASEEPVQVEQRPPYEIGLRGTVEDFYAAVKAAEEDIEVKRDITEKSLKKYQKFFGGEGRHRKYCADKKAFEAAQKVPDQIRSEFHRSTCDAFLDNPSRPDNLLHILSHPGEFLFEDKNEKDLIISTLITLLDKSDTPDTVLDITLAKFTGDERQDILDSALLELVWNDTIIEDSVSALLKEGADASHESSRILACCFHKEATVEVKDMLLENGATLDAALQWMRNHRDYYGNLPEKIEALEYRKETDARIRELELKLEEATREHTEKKPKEPDAAKAAPTAPAKTAAPPIKLKVSTAGPQ